MNRKDFILKTTGMLLLGGITISGFSQNNTIKYCVVSKRCDGCGHCFRACRDKALTVTPEGKATIDPQKCTGCGDCSRFCRRMAIIEASKNPQS